MKKTNTKRKQVFIQKKYQLRSILTIVAIIMLTGIISGLILYFILSNELSSNLQAVHVKLENIWDKLGIAIILGHTITILLTSLAAIYAVLYQSHKIAGPLYRFKSICNEVALGNYQPFSHLRKKDQLIDLASAFQTMLISLKSRQSKHKELTTKALDLVSELQKKENLINNQSLVKLKKILVELEDS